MIDQPFFARPARNETFEVADRVHTILDQLPTEVSAENVARAMNNAYRRGYYAAQADMRFALGLPQ